MRSLEQLDRWLASKVRGWTGKVAGSGAPRELLEVRRDILDEIRDHIEPAGEGRSVFPFGRVTVRIAAEDERQRAVCTAALGREALEQDIRGLLAESGAPVPPGFSVTVELVDDPDMATSGRPFAVELSAAAAPGPPPIAAQAAGPRPRARLRVLAGKANTSECEVRTSRFNIGRLIDVVGERDGLRRRNDLAFDETETTVSREHAFLRFDPASGRYRLCDPRSQRGTVIFRDGRRIEVPRGAAQGVQLRSGDEIHFGGARVLFLSETGDPEGSAPAADFKS